MTKDEMIKWIEANTVCLNSSDATHALTTVRALAKHRARRLRNDYAKVSQALEENSWRWSPKSSKVSHVKQSSDIT